MYRKRETLERERERVKTKKKDILKETLRER